MSAHQRHWLAALAGFVTFTVGIFFLAELVDHEPPEEYR